MILAVSHAGDDHLRPVLDALRARGAAAAVVDASDFPVRSRLGLRFGPGRAAWRLDLPDGAVHLEEVRAIWWRRPRPVVLGPGTPPAQVDYALRQSHAALLGAWAAARTRWVNEPWADDAAGHKPRQLAAAERAGLAVPATLVTNDVEEARVFLAGLAGRPAVWKALHCTPEDWYPTRLLASADPPPLEPLRNAPAILQAYVPGVDVRVTAVGGELFAAEIDARATSAPHDFRPVYEACRVARCPLPDEVASRLRALMQELGLVYGAIDLRRTDDGRYVFLEVNPSGQWRFVEERTGLPITEAVAGALAGR